MDAPPILPVGATSLFLAASRACCVTSPGISLFFFFTCRQAANVFKFFIVKELQELIVDEDERMGKYVRYDVYRLLGIPLVN